MLGALSAIDTGRVVLRLPNWLGDVMLAVPAIRALGRALPRARLELMARPALAAILAACEPIADAIGLAGPASLAGVLGEARALRGARAAVLFPNSFRSALGPWLARVPIRVGTPTDGRRFLLTHPTREAAGVAHQARAYLHLVAGSDARLRLDAALRVGAEARSAGAALAPREPYAALLPGAAFGPAKCWGASRFGELGRSLARAGLEPLVLGTAGETVLCAEVAALAGGRSLAGQTDGAALVGLLAGAHLVVANDSGGMHLGAALGRPVLALFGATDPARSGPITGRTQVLYRRVACSPCGLRHCDRPSHECMEGLDVAGVTAAALALADDPRATGGGA